MMPCIRMKDGWLCVGNDPVTVEHGGKAYLFEWTAACGWVAVNKDRSERLSPVPGAVWDKVDKLPRPKD